VEADSNKSSTRAISSGVPQGSILSPLCFSMFIKDLCHVLRFFNFHFYEDDLQLHISGCRGGLDILADRLNDDLLAVHQWSDENGLQLNAQKSQALFVAKVSTPHTLPPLYLGRDSIEWTEQVKNHGMLLDGRLRFTGYDC
jgi:Reverse transcriptase (RNA-dependent DNA polymerase)